MLDESAHFLMLEKAAECRLDGGVTQVRMDRKMRRQAVMLMPAVRPLRG